MSLIDRLSLGLTRKVRARVGLWHLVFFVIIIALFQVFYFTLRNEVKAKEISVQATILSKYFYDCGLAIGAYGLTKNQMFAERYSRLAAQIPDALKSLDKLTAGQAESIRLRVRIIGQISGQGLAKLSQAKIAIDASTSSPLMDDQGQARKAYKEIKAVADQLQAELDGLVAEEKESFDFHPIQKLAHYMLLLLLFVYAICNFVVEDRLFKLLKSHSISLDT